MTQHQTPKNTPFEIERSSKLVAPLSLILTFTAAVAIAYAAWDSQKVTVANHEDRIKKLEQSQVDIAVIKNNVDWIRRSLEGRYSQGDSKQSSH